MPRKNLYRRFLVLVLCAFFVFCLACPAFAAGDGELDFQYVFSKDFTLADLVAVDGTKWYCLPFDVSAVADKVSADYVVFSIDGNDYRCSFMTFSRGLTYHYIGTPAEIFGVYDGSDFPFCLAMCQDDPTLSSLYLHSDLIRSLNHGNPSVVHIAISVAYNDPMTTGSLMEDTTSVFGSAISMVGSVARTVTSNPILFLPIVISLCGIGVAFFRRLKQ